MEAVDQYIAGFPPNVQEILVEIRRIIHETAPDAAEGMNYGMPSYKLSGNPLVYYAGYKNHIGFYATPSGHEAFRMELMGYKKGRGSVQFPLTKPIPYDLIRQMVEFRVSETKGL